MFKLVSNLTCWWPVKVIEPDPDKLGKHIEHQFEAEFTVLDREDSQRIDELRAELLKGFEKAVERGEDGKVPTDVEEKLKKAQAELDAYDVNAFRRVLKDWRGILDDDGQPFRFSEENFLIAMKHERIRVGLNRAYQEAISQDKARLKN
jgi:hypothetical protein